MAAYTSGDYDENAGRPNQRPSRMLTLTEEENNNEERPCKTITSYAFNVRIERIPRPGLYATAHVARGQRNEVIITEIKCSGCNRVVGRITIEGMHNEGWHTQHIINCDGGQ